MKRRTFITVIVLAILAIGGVILAQYLWMQSALSIQASNRSIQEEQAQLEEKQFNDRVSIALTNVAEEIVQLNEENAIIYDVVAQLRSNYFTVQIADTLHPYLLETLLKREFTKRSITEDFEYGIYDCFTDSVVYGQYVSMTDSSSIDSTVAPPQVRWDKDAHYFSVFFPNRSSHSLTAPETRMTSWVLSSIIILIVLSFLAFAIFVMLRQKRLSEVKTDFINNMTHELKTPISTISLSSEVLLRDDVTDDPERIHQYAKIIYDENTRLKSQVERVLQLATLDSDRLKLKVSEIDLHEIIQSAIDAQLMSVNQKGGEIKLNLRAHNSIIFADRVHITNMVYNLIDNAIKYTPEEPKIIITTLNKDNGITLHVADNGIGMSKDAIKNIFEKFYRVPTGNIHDVKGFGLGLHYVKVMVDAHKGEISVDSTPGKGSTFKVWLPFKS